MEFQLINQAQNNRFFFHRESMPADWNGVILFNERKEIDNKELTIDNKNMIIFL